MLEVKYLELSKNIDLNASVLKINCIFFHDELEIDLRKYSSLKKLIIICAEKFSFGNINIEGLQLEEIEIGCDYFIYTNVPKNVKEISISALWLTLRDNFEIVNGSGKIKIKIQFPEEDCDSLKNLGFTKIGSGQYAIGYEKIDGSISPPFELECNYHSPDQQFNNNEIIEPKTKQQRLMFSDYVKNPNPTHLTFGHDFSKNNQDIKGHIGGPPQHIIFDYKFPNVDIPWEKIIEEGKH